MNNLNLKNITESLLDAFLKAGKIAREISLEGVKITIKKDNSPVTNGDLAVDEILQTEIKKLTPNIPVISEETIDLGKENTNKDFWLVDPIDGTRDYIKKGDEYTLNAALIIDLKLAIGIVYAPNKDRLFFSYGNDCAFEINSSKKKKIDCKKVNTNQIIGLTNSDKTSDEIMNIYKKNNVTKMIKVASSYKFCVLASGEADIYAALPRAYEWDIAAGHAILEHAGGSVTSHGGTKILYGKKDYKNLGIIAKRSATLDR